jgi:cyclopropane-fatty-acyl-phospholipid synthase
MSLVRSHPSSSSTTIDQPGLSDLLGPLLSGLWGDSPPVRFEFWDGTGIGPTDGPGTVRLRSAEALRGILWTRGDLGPGRAFVTGHLDIEGDLFGVLRALEVAGPDEKSPGWGAAVRALGVARRLGILRGPLPAPPEELRARGRRHSLRRDCEVVTHHYDVGNDFYRLVLGPSLTYSCARFDSPTTTLEQAQEAKHEMICRKLGLADRPGLRLLDVGCGWGSMALHAARAHKATVLGITLSHPQAELARQRIEQAGLSDSIEIRVQDYRELKGETFDAISSIGMFEHVGESRLEDYLGILRGLLTGHGRLLNHGISAVGGSRAHHNSFMGRYVFPDGEVIDVGRTILAMERTGFEIRDVESLREHYATTLRAWVAGLESGWAEAVDLVGERRARVWRMYMAGCALAFENGTLGLHQVLGVVPGTGGGSGMPPTRAGWS